MVLLAEQVRNQKKSQQHVVLHVEQETNKSEIPQNMNPGSGSLPGDED